MGAWKTPRTAVALMVALAVVSVSLSVVLAADTGWENPSANAADTGGDGDGFERNPANAYADGPGVAENRDGRGDRHRYYSYGFSIPANATINGIAVRLDWYLDDHAGTSSMGVELSWDGGSSWTTAKTDWTEPESEHTTTLGGATDTWDHGWTVAQINYNFVVRLACSSDRHDRDFFLDWVPVKVYYTPNQPPVVGDIPDQTITEGQSFTTFDLDDYVEDPDDTDAEMTWTYSGNTELTVSINGSRVATIGIPSADWNGFETITFTATDPGSLSDSNPATFTVNAVNDAPVVTDIPDQTIAEGGSFATISLDDYVSDVDNTDAEMTWSYSGNTELTVSINGSRVATIGIPNADWYGFETITFTATDPGSLSDSNPATFTVNAVNDAPVVTDIPDQTIAEGGSFATISLDDYVSDVDNTDAEMTWSYSGNTELTVSINGSRVATIGIPSADWNGSETITFTAEDLVGGTDSDAASFTVTAVNDSPVANDDSDTTPEDTPVSTNVVANDTDVDGTVVASTVTVVSGPSNGSVVNNGNGTVTYTPDENFNGSDSFTYTVKDNDGATSNVATVTINVGVVNDPPVANDDNDTTPEDTPVTTNVVANDTDVDGTVVASAVAIVSGPSDGSVVNNGNGTVTYTPDEDFNGSDSFTYTVKDNYGATSNVATVTINVGVVNDPPIANDDMVLADEGASLSIEVTLNDKDPDGTIDPATIMIDDAPVSGTVRVAEDGTVTYSPDPNFSGPDFFTYTVDDNEGATSNVATVVVMVGEVYDPPVAEDDLATTEAGVPVNIDVLANDSDPDGSLIPGTVTIISGPESGTATANWDGTITYTSVDGFVGTDQFTYTVEDDDAIASEATVTVEVLKVTGGGGTELADTVSGTEVLSGRVIGVKTVENDPLTFEVSFQNTGNVQLRPKGRLDIISRSGDTVRSIIIEEFPLLPRAVRYLRIVDTSVEPLSPGRYLALAVLDFGNPDYLTGGQLAFDVKELYLVPIGDSASLPRDLDGDGLYEHINGDGKLTLEDPALLGFYIDSPAVQENTKAFDFNNDGIVNFNDAVVLKSMVEEQQIR